MRKLTILATAALLLLPAVSQAKTLEELLVEKGVISKSELRAASSNGGSRVYWNDGTRLEFPDAGFTAKINTQLQTRYEFLDADDEIGIENVSSFSVRRAKIVMSGTALNEEFTYKLQTNFAGGSRLEDAYMRWAPCEGGWMQMGQFKNGLSRQWNNSSTALQFPERSIASQLFTFGRQPGVSGQAELWDGRLDLGAQLMNGESDGEGQNLGGTDTKHTVVVTARADLMGEMNPWEEGDIEGTQDTALNMGFAYMFSDYEATTGDLGALDYDRSAISTDVNLKTGGWSFHGEFFWGENELDDVDDSSSEPIAFYAQGGYFIEPQKLEVALRYSFIDCDDGSACDGVLLTRDDFVVDDANEVDASINYYWWKHNLKAQLAYFFLNQDEAVPGGEDGNTSVWLFQLSGWF